jgi:hypothetical protein
MYARGILGLLVVSAVALDASASLPPWTDPNDVPLPPNVHSITPKRDELSIFAEPGRSPMRRGTVPKGSRLPFFGSRRGPSCVGRWLLVGPLAWVCSDQAVLSEEPPATAASLVPFSGTGSDDGLPYRYYFVGRQGAFAWDRLEHATDDPPDQELDPGFAVAATDERSAFGERWLRTTKGRFIPLRDLAAAHPSGFSGEAIATDGRLDFGWVVVDRTVARAKPSGGAKAIGPRVRFERVRVAEVRGTGLSAWLRISADGEPEAWLPAREVARPTMAARPAELDPDERWIDVELATQTLVAYEGDKPVFSTLVSSGRGPPGSETATPVGTSRIWVKLHASTMDNLEKRDDDAAEPRKDAKEEDGEEGRLYSLDDVPYVQFFNKAVALHGVFWHRNFGRVQSHGCVNLAPKDARFLFGWTLPRLPRGWSAALPTPTEKGTLIRVR